MESTHLDTLPITRGVLQGAILSPLLFSIYLNDLPFTPRSCNLESYVDDSKLFLFFPLSELDAAIGKLEQDLLSVAQWCCENHLLINPDKTKLLFLGTRQMSSRLTKNRRTRVILDPHLTYDHHISKTVSSCFSAISNK